MHLGHYRDPRALPALLAAYDTLPLDEKVSLMGNQALVELKASIEDLGGTLTAEQEAKYAAAVAPQEAFRRRMDEAWAPSLAEAAPPRTAPSEGSNRLPVRVPPRPGRNEPCPCGSGRKYKKCHG